MTDLEFIKFEIRKQTLILEKLQLERDSIDFIRREAEYFKLINKKAEWNVDDYEEKIKNLDFQIQEIKCSLKHFKEIKTKLEALALEVEDESK